MNQFHPLIWIFVILFSTSLISTFIGNAQEAIQTRFHSALTFDLLIKYYPFSLLIVVSIFIIDFIIFFYREKIIITNSEIEIHHLIMRKSLKKEKYEKAYCKIRLESREGKIFTEKSKADLAFYIVRLRYDHPFESNMIIDLISFNNKNIELGHSYILNLKKNNIELHDSVENFFQTT